MRSFVVATVFVVGACLSGRAEACSCLATSIEDQARGTAVVLVGEVLDDSGDASQHVSRVRVVEGLRGVHVGEELVVRWLPPDGESCFFIAPRPGRWLLFLEREPTGVLVTLACDVHSTPIRGARAAAALGKVRAALAAEETAEAVVARALPVANRALDQAYARAAAAVHPRRSTPWVTAPDAQSEREARGWRVRWTHHPPAGFEYDVVIDVPRKRPPRVIKASASFASD